MAQHFPSVSLYFQTRSFPSNESHYQMLNVRGLPAILRNLCKRQNNDIMCIRLGLVDSRLKPKEPLWASLILAPPILQHPLPVWPRLFVPPEGWFFSEIFLLASTDLALCCRWSIIHWLFSTPNQIICIFLKDRKVRSSWPSSFLLLPSASLSVLVILFSKIYNLK